MDGEAQEILTGSDPRPINSAAGTPPAMASASSDAGTNNPAPVLPHDDSKICDPEASTFLLDPDRPRVVPSSATQEPHSDGGPAPSSVDHSSALSGEPGPPPSVLASANSSQPPQATVPDDIQREIEDAVHTQIATFREAKRAKYGNVLIPVAEEVRMGSIFRAAELARRGITIPAKGAAARPEKAPFEPQTIEKFLEKDLAEKKNLVEGLLYKGDIVALAGRRRHGKTTLISNLALSLAIPRADFLGFAIPAACRVVAFFLEDDPRELQLRFRQMGGDSLPDGSLGLYTRDDFYSANVPIDGACAEFQQFVRDVCQAHKPDLIILDNLAHLVSANYNDSKAVHALMRFLWRVSKDFDVAIIVAAHPRKRDKKRKGDPPGRLRPGRLRDVREDFFEEVMGSSHFVNCCGSLWAIERDQDSDRTDFLAGAQRYTGQQELMTLEKDDLGWLQRVSEGYLNLANALSTDKRKRAWRSLPDGAFSYTEAERAVKPVLSSSSSFHAFFEACKREKVIIESGEHYKKAPGIELGPIEV